MSGRYGSTHLVDDDEEQAVCQNAPDEDVAKDASDEGLGIRNHDGSIPVDGHESPGQWARHDWQVNESGVCVVAEVQRRQVDEVEDDDELRPAEQGPHEQHDERKVEQVVQNKVAADSAGRIDFLDIAGEEMRDVTTLENEQDNPNPRCSA